MTSPRTALRREFWTFGKQQGRVLHTFRHTYL